MQDEVIAERTLKSARDPAEKVIVRLAKPKPNPRTKDYQCAYEVEGFGAYVRRSAAGLDAFQALQLAFVMIGGELAAIESRVGVKLQFGDGDTGFPRP